MRRSTIGAVAQVLSLILPCFQTLLTLEHPPDSASFVLALVLLCTIIALYLANYSAIWLVFLPALHLVLAVFNFVAFSSDVMGRFANRQLLVFLTVCVLNSQIVSLLHRAVWIDPVKDYKITQNVTVL
jgi:hypothetical protein